MRHKNGGKHVGSGPLVGSIRRNLLFAGGTGPKSVAHTFLIVPHCSLRTVFANAISGGLGNEVTKESHMNRSANPQKHGRSMQKDQEVTVAGPSPMLRVQARAGQFFTSPGGLAPCVDR